MSDSRERHQELADSESLAEVREWLVRIDANQTHQTHLLESLTTRAEKALDKADVAEDKADKALAVAKRVDKRVDDREQEERIRTRWLIGLVASVLIATLPMIARFYGVN